MMVVVTFVVVMAVVVTLAITGTILSTACACWPLTRQFDRHSVRSVQIRPAPMLRRLGDFITTDGH